MKTFEVINVTRKFGKKECCSLALSDVSFSLPSKGLYAIVGKSGSGKTTLLNILAGSDKPSEGKVLFLGKDISKFRKKELEDYRCSVCGFVFQHFNLLEDLTAYQNVELALKIKGFSDNEIKEMANKAFKRFNIEDLANKRVKLLSGGEKQRVAFIRATISKPKVIFADEPTGALDKDNETYIMDALKEASKDALVILVTHNEKLIDKYVDDYMRLEDGKVIKEFKKTYDSGNTGDFTVNKRKSKFWGKGLFLHNYRKNMAKNALSLTSGILGYLALLMSLGFYYGSRQTLENERTDYLNYTQASISKQVRYEAENVPIALIKNERPTLDECEKIFQGFDSVIFKNDYSFFFPSYNSFTLNGFPHGDATFVALEDLSLKNRTNSFLLEGELPSGNTLNYCVVNEEFKKQNGNDVLGKRIKASNEVMVEKDQVRDNVRIDLSFLIIGVVKEFSFLNMPKIFYSYPAFQAMLERIELENVGMSLGSLLKESENESYFSYSYNVFFNEGDAKEIEKLAKKLEKEESEFVISSTPFTINSSFQNLYEAFSKSLLPFLIIEVLSVCFILCSLTYHSFLERRKQAAIVLSLGAREGDTNFIYQSEPIINNLFASVVALSLSLPLSDLLSKLLERKIGLSSIIKIPYISFLGIRYFPFVFLICFSLLIAIISCSIPLFVSKKRNLLEELRDE